MRRHVALVATGVLVAALVGPSHAQAVGLVLLPDLRQAPVGCAGGFAGDPAGCADWDVCPVADAAAPNGECVATGPIGAVRLRFTTSADNVGDGPLLIHGSRRDTGQARMTARQAFQSAVDGSVPMTYEQAQQAIPTALYYEPAAAHQPAGGRELGVGMLLAQAAKRSVGGLAGNALARERGAVLVQMSCAGGHAQRLLERAGYRRAEVAMVK